MAASVLLPPPFSPSTRQQAQISSHRLAAHATIKPVRVDLVAAHKIRAEFQRQDGATQLCQQLY